MFDPEPVRHPDDEPERDELSRGENARDPAVLRRHGGVGQRDHAEQQANLPGGEPVDVAQKERQYFSVFGIDHAPSLPNVWRIVYGYG